MSEAAKFFENFKKDLVSGIYTTSLALVEAYDPKLNKADIKLLPGGNLIKSVPVAIQQTKDFFIRVPYQKGDHVLVVFAQRDIDAVMYGSSNIPSERMLAIDDAIIIGGVNIFSDPLPAADADKLVIGQKDSAAKITIGGGKISLVGNVDIVGGAVKITGDTITANGEDLTVDNV